VGLSTTAGHISLRLRDGAKIKNQSTGLENSENLCTIVVTLYNFEFILTITDDTRSGRGLLAVYMNEIDDTEEGAVSNETPLKACVPDRRCFSPELDVVGVPNRENQKKKAKFQDEPSDLCTVMSLMTRNRIERDVDVV